MQCLQERQHDGSSSSSRVGDFMTPRETLTDREFLLHVLSDHREHTLNEIIQRSFSERGCGLTPHSRAAELRKCGYTISNRPMPNGGRGSVYRLIPQPYLCEDCGRRFFNEGWHAEACGSPNYQRLSGLESPAMEEPGPQPVSLAGGSSAGDHAPSKDGRSAGRRATTETQALDSIEQPALFTLPRTYGEAA